MLSYLANHAIPIELSLTNLYKKLTTNISTTENALRLFFDRGLKVAPCSLDLSLYRQSRNEMIFKMAERANFTAREVVQWILFSFKAAYQNYVVKHELFSEAYQQAKDIIHELRLDVDI